MCWIQLSQMEYSAAKCASRSIAAGSQGSSLSSMARTGSLNVLKAHRSLYLYVQELAALHLLRA